MDRTGEPFSAAELSMLFDLDADAAAIERVEAECVRQEAQARRLRFRAVGDE